MCFLSYSECIWWMYSRGGYCFGTHWLTHWFYTIHVLRLCAFFYFAFWIFNILMTSLTWEHLLDHFNEMNELLKLAHTGWYLHLVMQPLRLSLLFSLEITVKSWRVYDSVIFICHPQPTSKTTSTVKHSSPTVRPRVTQFWQHDSSSQFQLKYISSQHGV